jgi:hypothetical protein
MLYKILSFKFIKYFKAIYVYISVIKNRKMSHGEDVQKMRQKSGHIVFEWPLTYPILLNSKTFTHHKIESSFCFLKQKELTVVCA